MVRVKTGVRKIFGKLLLSSSEEVAASWTKVLSERWKGE